MDPTALIIIACIAGLGLMWLIVKTAVVSALRAHQEWLDKRDSPAEESAS